MRPGSAGSLPGRSGAIVVGQETDGRAARKRPRPGAEGLSFGAMSSLGERISAATWRPRLPLLRCSRTRR